ncbi:MAG: FHA domain-containing protein [Rhodocyclaceae bacterium]|nr:FHA domain-containing protein [Rhodocyclaceae bacterium]
MVAKLILSMDGLVLKEIPLSKQRLSIGRKPHNDVQIDNLAVSGEHCVVVTILDDSFLEDLNSTNGTYVNGQPVKKHVLENRDIIELGKYRLKYLKEDEDEDFEARRAPPIAVAATAPAPVPADATVPFAVAPSNTPFAAEGSKKPAPRAQPAAPAAPQAAHAPAGVPAEQGFAANAPLGAVQLLNGANAGKQLDLSKSLTKLGKPGTQVAVIARRDDGYFITHLEGLRHPVVNGRSIEGHAYPLKDHDIIELAGIKMEFFLKH